MHLENLHRDGYPFEKLVKVYPPLKEYVISNKLGKPTIDFSLPEAVKALNRALLKEYYNIQFWDIPQGYLCPPVPGRADYILAIDDLLQATTKLDDKQIKGLDIGTGANLIYPLIGHSLFGWKFIGSEIEDIAIENAVSILKQNRIKPKSISVRKQNNKAYNFKGILKESDRLAFSMCNPPFHKSQEEANKGTLRKVKNLTGKADIKLNFGGQSNELWCDGGELQFIKNMINESKEYKHNVVWFTSLVSKQENVKPLLKHLKSVKPSSIKVVDMGQGQKKSRFVAWSFLTK